MSAASPMPDATPAITLDEAVQEVRALEGAVNAHQGRRQELQHQADDLQRKLDADNALAADWERAGDVLRSFGDEQSERLRMDIERLVTHGLRAVFGEDLVFVVRTRLLRGQPAVEFALVSPDHELGTVERPVLGAHGGGVAQVVAFVLRVVVTLLSTRDPLLILDEPFGQVSANLRPRLAQFIREIVDSTNLQLVIVTHDEHIPEVADKHYAVSLRGTTTHIEDVEDALPAPHRAPGILRRDL